jgi:hypothetical protein
MRWDLLLLLLSTGLGFLGIFLRLRQERREMTTEEWQAAFLRHRTPPDV